MMSSEPELFAVAGNPVLHSRSPRLFNAAFAHSQYPGVYTRLHADSASEVMEISRSLGLKGINITSPFKEDIINYLTDIDDEAAKIGAVNTVVFRRKKSIGYNTDHEGVIRTFESRNIPLAGKRAVVVGAGGAARAAVYGLIKRGSEVVLLNRTEEKAEKISKYLNCRWGSLDNLEKEMKEADILVSCIPQSFSINPGFFREGMTILDARYGITHSPDDRSHQGCTILNPLDWLLYQALPAYRHFTGTDAPLEVMRESLRSEVSDTHENISLVGFIASGKTSVGEELSRLLDRDLIDIDTVIEKKYQTSISAIFATEGEEAFREVETEELQNASSLKDVVISCGGGVVVNPENISILRENSIPIWLWADLDTVFDRLRGNSSRPLLNVKNRREVAEYLLSERLHRYASTASLIVNTTGKDPDEIAKVITDEICKTFKN